MILLTGFYRDPDPARCAELLECLRRNAENADITQIHVLVEAPADPAEVLQSVSTPNGAKLRTQRQSGRLTFEQLFAYANTELAGQRIIIANADIFFDTTLRRLEDLDLTGKLLCLSRWDVQADGGTQFFNHPASQDAWIFSTPMRPFRCGFPLGVPACENRLAWEAEQSGLALSNPSLSVHANHLHLSGTRRYSERDRVPGPTRQVAPGFLGGAEAESQATVGRPARARVSGNGHRGEVVAALTSLPPGRDRLAHHRKCIASWRAAGMEVFSFNHPSEIDALRTLYEATFVPVADTAASILGRSYIPINAMLDWAVARGGPVLVVNSDIELRMSPAELKRLRWICDRGLCYFVRWNYDRDIQRAAREPYGIDAFLLDAGDADLFPPSFLSMGQPFWDYWLPYTFAQRGRPVYTIESPVLFHKDHPRRWSPEAWHRCALEFDRLFALLGEDRSYPACMLMSGEVRAAFESRKYIVPAQPAPIRAWMEQKFSRGGPKTFLELGAHDGSDTAWMAALPDVRIHAFEPDPRNCPPSLPNVTMTRAAVSDREGRMPFVLSQTGWGRPWTYSSSLKQPKGHLARYPVSFGETIEVESVTLDAYARRNDLGRVDFIWADIQGAEGEMIRGGRDLLSRTRYLYTEYSDDELYEGQATLGDICDLLPGFRVVELWPDEVLLQNESLESDF